MHTYCGYTLTNMQMHSLPLCLFPHALVKAHAHRLCLSFVVVRRWFVGSLLVGLFISCCLVCSLSHLTSSVGGVTTLRAAIFRQLLVVNCLRPVALA